MLLHIQKIETKKISADTQLTHNIISKKTEAIDGVVGFFFVFLLVYGERYLHVLHPAAKKTHMYSSDVCVD